jgi:hypothetical protein
MASNTEIANKAISHLGIMKPINELDTTNSASANAIRLHYDTALRETLRSFYWPFAGRYADLTLEEEDPNDDWNFSYRYPPTCLVVRKILRSGNRTPASEQRTMYQVGGDENGQLIYTDVSDATIWFTKYIDNPDLYPADFVMAFSAKLAWIAAPMIIGGNYQELRKEVAGFYDIQIKTARVNAMNESQPDPDTLSAFERARG